MKKLLFSLLLILGGQFSLHLMGQIYINFEGIDGDLGKSQVKGTMLQSLSVGSTNATTIGSATTGAGAGKAKLEDITFTKLRGKISTVLQQRLYSGQHFQKVVINYYKPGQADPFMVITLSTVFITKIDIALAGTEPPQETMTLTYGAIKIEDNYGEPNKPSSGWNAMTNKAQ